MAGIWVIDNWTWNHCVVYQPLRGSEKSFQPAIWTNYAFCPYLWKNSLCCTLRVKSRRDISCPKMYLLCEPDIWGNQWGDWTCCVPMDLLWNFTNEATALPNEAQRVHSRTDGPPRFNPLSCCVEFQLFSSANYILSHLKSGLLVQMSPTYHG